MDIRWIAAAALLPLGACASTGSDAGAGPATSPSEMACKADAVQSYVGQTATPALGGTLVKEAGARTLRWGPPRSPMTMDYRIDRLNVIYDDDYKITQITCG